MRRRARGRARVTFVRCCLCAVRVLVGAAHRRIGPRDPRREAAPPPPRARGARRGRRGARGPEASPNQVLFSRLIGKKEEEGSDPPRDQDAASPPQLWARPPRHPGQPASSGPRSDAGGWGALPHTPRGHVRADYEAVMALPVATPAVLAPSSARCPCASPLRTNAACAARSGAAGLDATR